VDRQRGTTFAQRHQVFAFRHGSGADGCAGDNHRLRDLWQGQLHLQRRRCCRKRRHAGRDVKFEAKGIQAAHLLCNGTVNGWIAGMDAGDNAAICDGRRHHFNNGIQVHRGGINHLCARFCLCHNSFGHQRACIEHKVCRLDHAEAPNCNQVGCAWPGTDEMDGHERYGLNGANEVVSLACGPDWR
jgi:hypothetical protein